MWGWFEVFATEFYVFFLRKIYFYMQNVMQYAKFNLTYNYPDHLWVCYIYILFIM